MRGKLRGNPVVAMVLRITPAHAGKTERYLKSFSEDADHPRACGENSEKWHKCSRGGGSPPRMRGKRTWSRRDSGFRRITPAHAGKTIRRTAQPYTCADHPRACGENVSTRTPTSTASGSPPRMRGKHQLVRMAIIVCRITPAHAGKTAFIFRKYEQGTDHPRACGENSDSASSFAS